MSDNKVEIIVLRRADAPAEKKKGGVWKIAHADFMTAMMAFFLIMWLVNATDEEIKKSIANYFNPLNLMAAPTDRRGVLDPHEDARPPDSGHEAGQTSGSRPLAADAPGDGAGLAGGGNVEQGNQNTMASAGILSEVDGPEFNDPYADLASQASDIDPDVPTAVDVTQTTLGASGSTTQSDDARDPFDPAYWQAARRRDDHSLRPGNPDTLAEIDPDAVIDAADATPSGASQDQHEHHRAGATDAASPSDQPVVDERLIAPGPASSVAEAVFAALAPPRDQPNQETAQPEHTPSTPAEHAASEIGKLLDGTGVEVSVSDASGSGEGPVLISLTDEDGRISMFPIGSADPNPAAVDLFAKVANALASRDGTIVVRGHTDARPFRTGTSDNWVLSFQRAHATKEALTANGIDERRIRRVEGLADRDPSRPEDPFASENRRIEILYEPAETAQ